MLTLVETGAMDGLVAIKTINLEDNRLPTIPAALRGMSSLALGSLEFLRLTRNHVTQVLTGDLLGLTSVFSLLLHDNNVGQVDPEAFDNLTSMAVLPDAFALTQATYNGESISGLPVTGAQPADGGFGGRVIKTPALTLSGNPRECRWVGPTVKDVDCTECIFGRAPDPDDPRVCILPEFHASVAQHPALVAAFSEALGEQGALHVGQSLTLPPPLLLEPRKTKFRGHAAQDFNAIHHELEFPGSPVDLGCDRPVIGDTSQDDAVQLEHTKVCGWDKLRNRFNWADRHKVFRINVTQAGNFSFDSCDSSYDTTPWLFRLGDVRLTNNLCSGDTWPADFADDIGPSVDPVTGDVSFEYSWHGGCELSGSTRRSVSLELGEYELIVRGSPFANDRRGVYVTKMDCVGDASATSPTIADPGGIAVDRWTGAISGQPRREGLNHAMRLVAVDGAGARTSITNWTFDVTNPQFKVRDTWPSSTRLDTVRNVRNKYHVNEAHFIESPGSSNEAMFVNPAQGGFANITFGLSVIPDDGDNLCPTNSTTVVLTQFQTGAASITIPCVGNYTARLIARDLAGTDAVLDEWPFQVLPKDTDVASNGPNREPCERSEDAVDVTLMDESFTCRCPDGVAGDKCQYSAAATCNGVGDVQDDGTCECNSGHTGDNCDETIASIVATGMSIALALVLVAGGLAFAHRRREQLKPYDFSEQLSQLGDANPAGAADGSPAFAEEGRSLVPDELSRGSVTLLSILGSGQFGEVREGLYHAKGTSQNSECSVAVKTLKGEPTAVDKDEFFREALITAQFDHVSTASTILPTLHHGLTPSAECQPRARQVFAVSLCCSFPMLQFPSVVFTLLRPTQS